MKEQLFNFKKFDVPMNMLKPCNEDTYTLIPGEAENFLNFVFSMYTDIENPFEIHSGRDSHIKEMYLRNDDKLMQLCRNMMYYQKATNGEFGLGITKEWIENHRNKPGDGTIYWMLTTTAGKLVKSKYTSESVRDFVIALLNTPDLFKESVHYDLDMNTVEDNEN